MAALRIWQACSPSRHGLQRVSRLKTPVVSQSRSPVYKDVQILFIPDIERYEAFDGPADTSTDSANICVLRGYLHVLWRSKDERVIEHEPQRQLCQGTGRHAGRSRKQRSSVARTAMVLTITIYNVTPLIDILWLYSYNGKILANGTQGFETGSSSLDLGGCSQSWEVATMVFCWMLMMTTTAACFQADTSDSKNKISSHLSLATMMYLQYFEPNN